MNKKFLPSAIILYLNYFIHGIGCSILSQQVVKELLADEDRIIDVEWYNAEQVSYKVDIEVFANDRNGILSDIIQAIGNTKLKLIAINSKANKEKIVITEVTIKVENLEELNKALRILRKIDSVYEVKRKK